FSYMPATAECSSRPAQIPLRDLSARPSMPTAAAPEGLGDEQYASPFRLICNRRTGALETKPPYGFAQRGQQHTSDNDGYGVSSRLHRPSDLTDQPDYEHLSNCEDCGMAFLLLIAIVQRPLIPAG